MDVLYAHGLILPALALIIWSLVVWAWMVPTRLAAMSAAKLRPSEGAHTDALAEKLPSNVRAISDNYNHLMEQPTLFYAACIIADVIFEADATSIGLAWGYVVIRVVHSLIQNLGNSVPLRFYAFVASTLVLAVLAVRTLLGLLAQ